MIKPEHRIYKRNETAATNDRNTFRNWERGRITSVMAAECLKNDNGWAELSVEEFEEIAHFLGYLRDGEKRIGYGDNKEFIRSI